MSGHHSSIIKHLDSSRDLLSWLISSLKFFIILSTVEAWKGEGQISEQSAIKSGKSESA